MKKSILEKLRSLKLENSDTWINEALFGYTQIQQYLKNLNPNDDVIEIGCGSGILLSIIKENYTNINIQGIEPFGYGFDKLRELNKLIQSNGTEINNISFEELDTTKKFDLIFSINVFEHLNDWKKFLIKAKYLLKKNGKLIILCPNYGFPYESHFKIPIIINKKLTYLIFKNFIKSFEEKSNIGLWKSLNFVKKREIKSFLKTNKHCKAYKMIDHKNIINYMITRSLNDSKFRERQKFISYVAIFFRKIGIIKLLILFPDYLPYMKLELFIEN